MIPKNVPANRIVKINSNPEIKRRLSNQKVSTKENNQPVRKVTPIQQAKKRSILAKSGSRKVQKRVDYRSKSRSGESK